MDHQQTPSAPSKKSPPANEELFDDFDFKPLTTGLGFNHSNKADEAVQQARQQVVERSTPVRTPPLAEHPITSHQRTAQAGAPASDYVQNDLALFYNKGQETNTFAIPEAVVVKRPQLADVSVRLIAFSIDMLLLSCITWLTFALVSYLTGVDFAASLLEGHTDMMIVVGVLFAGYFVLYFTLMEKFQGSSLGKELLDLKIITMDGYGPSLLRAAARTFITLVGILSLGLTTWADLPGKLTGTRVVKA